MNKLAERTQRSSLPVSLETRDILRLLPHRYPFLLIDRIIEIRGDEFGIGLKNVTINEPFFAGHFPGRPVMPGVLVIEGMAQTAGAISALSFGVGKSPSPVYLLTVDKAKFRHPVGPGYMLEYHVTKKTRKKNMCWFRAEAKVAGKVVAEAEIGAMIAED
jgi:3-hydroxyacyl-[acyl-carrier-protein] dehydratase